jgi:hypothetical protein
MPQYAGNLYDQTNATEVAVNTRRAQPSILFGTRNLQLFTFSIYYNLYANQNYFNSAAVTVTGGSADGQQVTYTFAAQAQAPFAVGDTVRVSGMTHGQYNGEYTVVAATNTSITVDWPLLGVSVSGGSIVRAGFRDPDSFYSDIVRAIQKVAEIYYLGQPTYRDAEIGAGGNFGNFVFAISDDLTTSNYDEAGYDYPEEGHDPNEDSHPTDLASALSDALRHTWGQNGDGWSLAVCDDLGWAFAPGVLAGDPGFSLAYLNSNN